MRGAARSAAATLPRRYVGDLVELGSTSDILSGASVDEKFRKFTSIAPRSAREFLADGRDMDP